MQRNISRAARSKQAVVELERELERLLHERKALSNDLANVKRRQASTDATAPELASEEDTLSANLSYVQDNITQIQHAIMELEDGRENTPEAQLLTDIVDEVHSIDEAKFLLEKLCNIAIMQTCDIALAQTRQLEREAILDEVQQESSIQQQLLQHVLSQNPSLSLSEASASTTTTTSLTTVSSMQPLLRVTVLPNAGELGQLHGSPPILQRQATFDLPPTVATNHAGQLDNRPRTRSTTSSRSSSPVALMREHSSLNDGNEP